MRVLVVDDDAHLRHSVARYLNRHGFDVSVAVSFSDALGLCDRYDVGSLDLDLGDGNGVDLAEELLLRGTIARVLFLTGSPDDALTERAASLGPVFTKGNWNVLEGLVDALRGREPVGAAAVGCGDVVGATSTVPPRSGSRRRR